MSHYKFLSGAIAVAALLIVAPAAQAQQYYGPTKVGDKCFKRYGHGESLGYWEGCPAATSTAGASGRSANASVTRASARKKANR
jgi:hypothetical protein